MDTFQVMALIAVVLAIGAFIWGNLTDGGEK